MAPHPALDGRVAWTMRDQFVPGLARKASGCPLSCCEVFGVVRWLGSGEQQASESLLGHETLNGEDSGAVRIGGLEVLLEEK